MPKSSYRGRVAPTPSGFLHIGHIATFSTAMKRAQERDGQLVLRIEDIDRERCKAQYIQACVEDLKLAGIECTEGFGIGGDFAPYIQSERFSFYKDALKKLIDSGYVYSCESSRSEIARLAKFPSRTFEHCPMEAIFPTSLRPSKNKIPEDIFAHNWRFKTPFASVDFIDNNLGAQSFIGQQDFGDFLVWRKSGAPSYELAVVVDDIAMRITEVVRGADLLLSTARQILLYNAFAEVAPEFYHCELIAGNDGKKLSKSTMDAFDKKYLVRPERAEQV